MPVAIITGASRGLGLALARSLSADGWDLVIDARDAGGARRPRPRTRGPDVVRAVPGDVADAAHRADLVAAAADLGGLDLLVNNASVLGPSPQPPARRLPARRARARVRGQHRRAARARATRAAADPRDRHGDDRQHHVRRRGRAVRRLGRLRLVEGRARTDRQRARRPKNRSCTSTRSTPATCARRCIRRRSPARTSPIGPNPRPSFPRSLRLLRDAPPSGRYRGADVPGVPHPG